MVEYPEHEKLKAVQKESQIIGEFLEWLQSEYKVELSKYHEHTNGCYGKDGELVCNALTQTPMPIHRSSEHILSDYFKIDLKKIDEEKRLMLERMRT